MEKANPIREKSFRFALNIIAFCKILRSEHEFIISKQLLKSGTSIGANIEEGSYAQSKKDFVNKMSIALKEVHETHYWLRLIRDGKLSPASNPQTLIDDCMELHRILSSIVKTAKENLPRSILHS